MWNHITEFPIFGWLSVFTNEPMRDKHSFLSQKNGQWGLQNELFPEVKQ